MRLLRKYNWLIAFALIGCRSMAQNKELQKLFTEFKTGYEALEIPQIGLDTKVNFQNIQTSEALDRQKSFFAGIEKKATAFKSNKLTKDETIRLGQLRYETTMNLERIELEKKWNAGGRKIPNGSLYTMDDHKAWYSYYIRYFTSVNISPEEVFEMGTAEVKRVKTEIQKLQTALGFADEDSFYKTLAADSFYLTDKEKILFAYSSIDKTVRKNLSTLFHDHAIENMAVMEWPNAGPSTPPGIHLGKEMNAYGTDVFQFNFYGGRHNRRCMEWLYMHEGIPGHHLQTAVRRTQTTATQYFYFGNAEGWACYIEDLGKELGLYQNPYSHLGKWEWDLVRSARLVMEVGIHYYGWSFDKAKDYWKENIKGQDAIADREINRITNWAGQALCYKVGALTIKKIIAQRAKSGEDLKASHEIFLAYSDVPLQVLLDTAL